MPIYEYRCEECGEQTEVLQGVNDPPLGECPECSGAVKKLISAPAFQFKGSGWYVTDYAGKGKESKESTEKGGESSAPAAESGSNASGEGVSPSKGAEAESGRPKKAEKAAAASTGRRAVGR